MLCIPWLKPGPDTLLKLFVYYGHERMWQRISFGKIVPPEYEV